MHTAVEVKWPILLVRFYKNLKFRDRFSKKTQYEIWSKSVQWSPSCSMRTDTTKLNDVFRNFFKVSKIWSSPLTKISPACTGTLYKTVLILVNKQPATIFLYASFWNVIWTNRTADTTTVGHTYKSVTWRTQLWMCTFWFDNDLK